MKALKSPLMEYVPYRVPILKAMKRTTFSHFCARENVAEASDTLNRMWALGLMGILDYSLEDAVNNAASFFTTIQSTPLLPHMDRQVTHLYLLSILCQVICPKFSANFGGFGVTGKFFLCEITAIYPLALGKNQPLAKKLEKILGINLKGN